MILNIDFEAKIPLYFQLKEQIKQNILEGEYKDGDLIPSEREFSDNYGLSSTTIRRALNDLVQENYLERKAFTADFLNLISFALCFMRLTPFLSIQLVSSYTISIVSPSFNWLISRT